MSCSSVCRWLRLVGAPWKRVARRNRPSPARCRISGSGNQQLASEGAAVVTSVSTQSASGLRSGWNGTASNCP